MKVTSLRKYQLKLFLVNCGLSSARVNILRCRIRARRSNSQVCMCVVTLFL